MLKVADDRSFGVEVDYPASWTVTRDGWPELDTALADSMASVLTVPPGGEKAVIIGGGPLVPAATAATESHHSRSPSLDTAVVDRDLVCITADHGLPWREGITLA